MSMSALVIGHIAAGPEFKVTSLAVRLGAVVDVGRGSERGGKVGR